MPKYLQVFLVYAIVNAFVFFAYWLGAGDFHRGAALAYIFVCGQVLGVLCAVGVLI